MANGEENIPVVTEEELADSVFAQMFTVDQIVGYLSEVFTEERTDILINYLMDGIEAKLPWWLKFLSGLIRRALDNALPETLLDAIHKALLKLGMK